VEITEGDSEAMEVAGEPGIWVYPFPVFLFFFLLLKCYTLTLSRTNPNSLVPEPSLTFHFSPCLLEKFTLSPFKIHTLQCNPQNSLNFSIKT
jgi:hypothetical protein